ncbi:hypothetical protein P3X46_032424 [Hevea brasiliensis]|uniref:Shugoshin C-terminal domain-containing protein n=1 Tax=Hevea brasiliensis TaxID=3981 RepID=A0ABQ9KF70_HEVBR|nr:hypothetical protein P3X46_032424 [Hevea brasiliensis]
MVALKKAYAEIILNTAKEAASRVMASEKKAISYQQDLFTAKDEAIRLLVRLKQMIDAKIIEAEIASSSQQTKIDELEAQLQEAEGVIVDLRAELKWARDKLEKITNNQLQSLDGNITSDNEPSDQNATPEPNILSPNVGLQPVTTCDMKNSLFDQRILDNTGCNIEQTEQLSVSQFGSHSSHNTELASVIIRKEEPELYRNTERICAFEGNLLAGNLPPSGEVDEHALRKSELISKATNKDDKKSTVFSLKTKNLETAKNFYGEEGKKRVRVRTIRRRRTRFGKTKAKLKSCPSKLTKPYQPPSILSHCKRYLTNGNGKPDEGTRLPSIKTDNIEMKKHSSELEKKLHSQNSCITVEKMIAPEGKRQKTVQSADAMSTTCTHYPDQHKTCQLSSFLNQCKSCSLSLYGKIKLGNDGSSMTENEVKLNPLSSLDPALTLVKGGVNPPSGSTNVTVSVKALNRSGIIHNTSNKDVELADEFVKQEYEAAANSTLPCYESNPEMVNVPLVYSDLEHIKSSKEDMVDVPLLYSDLEDAKAPKESKVSPRQVDNNRLLKYTFQRKRKKEAPSSPDQNTSLEKSTVTRRAGEKHNGSPDKEKSSIINKSSRDSRRLAQVARQVHFFSFSVPS